MAIFKVSKSCVFQRGTHLVKTIVTPRTLASMMEEPKIEVDEFEFEVPELQLPDMDAKSDVGSHGSHESGAAGMLQV